MERLAHFNEAVDYIENHLTDNQLNLDQAAQLVLSSEYHFKRLFLALSGVSVSEYVRRRRLSLAASNLKESDLRIIDIAIKYGYTSADAFSRAFYSVHGILPSEARSDTVHVLNYPRLTFHLSIQGGEAMKYTIVEKEPFKLVGFKKRVAIQFEGVNSEIADMQELLTREALEELKNLSTNDPEGIISASTNFSEGRMQEEGKLDHYLGVIANESTQTSFDELHIEEGTWAIFEAVGPFPETLQTIWGRIYSEWFPSSEYELREGPELLWNADHDTSKPDFRSEIWIPVKKSNVT